MKRLLLAALLIVFSQGALAVDKNKAAANGSIRTSEIIQAVSDLSAPALVATTIFVNEKSNPALAKIISWEKSMFESLLSMLVKLVLVLNSFFFSASGLDLFKTLSFIGMVFFLFGSVIFTDSGTFGSALAIDKIFEGRPKEYNQAWGHFIIGLGVWFFLTQPVLVVFDGGIEDPNKIAVSSNATLVDPETKSISALKDNIDAVGKSIDDSGWWSYKKGSDIYLTKVQELIIKSSNSIFNTIYDTLISNDLSLSSLNKSKAPLSTSNYDEEMALFKLLRRASGTDIRRHNNNIMGVNLPMFLRNTGITGSNLSIYAYAYLRATPTIPKAKAYNISVGYLEWMGEDRFRSIMPVYDRKFISLSAKGASGVQGLPDAPELTSQDPMNGSMVSETALANFSSKINENNPRGSSYSNYLPLYDASSWESTGRIDSLTQPEMDELTKLMYTGGGLHNWVGPLAMAFNGENMGTLLAPSRKAKESKIIGARNRSDLGGDISIISKNVAAAPYFLWSLAKYHSGESVAWGKNKEEIGLRFNDKSLSGAFTAFKGIFSGDSTGDQAGKDVLKFPQGKDSLDGWVALDKVFSDPVVNKWKDIYKDQNIDSDIIKSYNYYTVDAAGAAEVRTAVDSYLASLAAQVNKIKIKLLCAAASRDTSRDAVKFQMKTGHLSSGSAVSRISIYNDCYRLLSDSFSHFDADAAAAPRGPADIYYKSLVFTSGDDIVKGSSDLMRNWYLGTTGPKTIYSYDDTVLEEESTGNKLLGFLDTVTSGSLWDGATNVGSAVIDSFWNVLSSIAYGILGILAVGLGLFVALGFVAAIMITPYVMMYNLALGKIPEATAVFVKVLVGSIIGSTLLAIMAVFTGYLLILFN